MNMAFDGDILRTRNLDINRNIIKSGPTSGHEEPIGAL